MGNKAEVEWHSGTLAHKKHIKGEGFWKCGREKIAFFQDFGSKNKL
jgi:hypothetical protein